MALATKPTFELRYRKEARVRTRGKMVRNQDRFAALPDQPPMYRPITGDYQTVSNEAVLLNEAQLRSGFLDYTFFPEVDTAPVGAEAIDIAE